jgi:hypothetical protein
VWWSWYTGTIDELVLLPEVGEVGEVGEAVTVVILVPVVPVVPVGNKSSKVMFTPK